MISESTNCELGDLSLEKKDPGAHGDSSRAREIIKLRKLQDFIKSYPDLYNDKVVPPKF